MFTGIIQDIGHIRAREERGGDLRLVISCDQMNLADIALGDSIAVSGVCLTAVAKDAVGFTADVSAETLARTTLRDVRVDDRVNLELALLPTTRLGGHLVSGHVDGVGEVLHRRPDARSERFTLAAPAGLARYIAEKGSVCVDGISLTVNAVAGREFDVNIVPHTLQATTLGECAPGRRVNLEVDIIARYLERLLLGGETAGGGVTRELLAARGFIKDPR